MSFSSFKFIILLIINILIISMSRKLPNEKPLTTMNAESDVYVVKYNVDGNYIMSGHSDRSVKVIL